ncbi:hypothetical protein [Agrobacterium cavarae]|uniref:hypothetical protein n=1 Tax=Agrobacterium cavarae TaxID=2528239 RepID=UPI0028A82C9E|nr:hypothetical protein [Agrobacterium cavarae]
MAEIELSEFDASVDSFEAEVESRPLAQLALPGIFGQMKEWLSTPMRSGGVNARKAAERIYATFQVVRAARGLLASTNEAHTYSLAIEALREEYKKAYAAALVASSSEYSITARLKGFSSTLKQAVERVKANTQAMNTVSEFIAGATAFVGALS